MEKVTRMLRGKSIQTAFAAAMAGGILAALCLSLFLSGLCQWGQSQYYKSYMVQDREGGPGLEIRFEAVEETEERMEISFQKPRELQNLLTSRERQLYHLLGILSVGVYPVCFFFCIILTSAWFYRRQLRRPLELLTGGARQIAAQNLDFSIRYEKEDEMGQVCASFDRMRLALAENQKEMWRQVEERRRLNAAFSHDLRTPLTVLRGQSELLLRYAPRMDVEKVVCTARTMQKHIARLEDYVAVMSDLQRLEDIRPARREVSLAKLAEAFRPAGQAVCGALSFLLTTETDKEASLSVDAAFVQRVFENLLSNAGRFARKRVEASLEVRNGYLYLTVTDDGDGFAGRDLAEAARPFYTSAGSGGDKHFGMGLAICKTLCEKHGGFLRLENSGGAMVTAVFRAGETEKTE